MHLTQYMVSHTANDDEKEGFLASRSARRSLQGVNIENRKVIEEKLAITLLNRDLERTFDNE